MLCQSLYRDVFYRLRALWITSRAMLSFGDQLFFAVNFRALAATPSPLHHVLALFLAQLVQSPYRLPCPGILVLRLSSYTMQRG